MRSRWIRQLRLVGCAAVLAATVSGAQIAAAQVRGGVLTIAAESDFAGFNAAKAKVWNQNSMGPASLVMETLFAYENEKIVPRLGLTLTEAPDGLSAVVQLRKGVKFHDDTPFDADAVVAHYRWMMSKEAGVNTAEIGPIKAVEKVDASAVRFVLSEPWAALRAALASEKLVNLIGSPSALQKDPEGFHRKPVGTGPFLFKEWRAGDRIELVRNPSYWDPKLPYVDRVVYRVLPDTNSRYQSVKSGEVDIARIELAGQVLEARKDPKLKLHEEEGSGAWAWIFNQEKPPFNDQRARAAVVQAINTKVLVDTLFMGTAPATTNLFGASSEWHCKNLRWRGHDVEKAKALVKEYGKPIKFQLVVGNSASGRRQGAMLQQFLQQAGIETELRVVEWAQMARTVVAGDYQMAPWRFADFMGDPDMTLTTYFGGTGGQPVTRHDTTKIDALLRQARSLKDVEARRKLYCDVAQIVTDEAIMSLQVRLTYQAVANPRVQGLPRMNNGLIRARSVWLEQK